MDIDRLNRDRLNKEGLIKALDASGSKVTPFAPEAIPAGITDAGTRRSLIEVGLPDFIEACIFFEGIDEPLQTLSEFNETTFTPPALADLYVIGVSDFYIIGLNGATGECFFLPDDLKNERSIPAASGLNVLVDMFLRLIEDLHFSDCNSDEDWDGYVDYMIDHLRTMEQNIPDISEEAWRKTINRCIGETLI